MKEIRLKWEPVSSLNASMINKYITAYLAGIKSGVTVMNNNTLFFTRNDRDHLEDAHVIMEKCKYLIDFEIMPMKNGGYLVWFNDVVAILVTSSEFQSMREEIIRRVNDLMFPEEVFYQDDPTQPKDNLLIGLYARGKLQYDAYHFSFYKRIEGKGK